MDPESRRFLSGGLAAGLGGLLHADSAPAADIETELRAGLRILSPPEGIAIDQTFGVPFRSPRADPFQDELFIPPVAEPAIDMDCDDWIWKGKDRLSSCRTSHTAGPCYLRPVKGPSLGSTSERLAIA